MIINQKLTINNYYEKILKIKETSNPKPIKIDRTPKPLETTPKSILKAKTCRSQFSIDRTDTTHILTNFLANSYMPLLKRQKSQNDDSKMQENSKNMHSVEQRSPKSCCLIKLKQQLNDQFLQESKSNNTENCLQLLEPALVHTIFKLSPEAKINSSLRASINAKDPIGNTALHFAAKNGNQQLIQALIIKNIDIDVRNAEDQTPLIIATINGKEEVVRILINAGADINKQDIHDNTALHYASKFSFKPIVVILLSKPQIILKLNKEKRYADNYATYPDIIALFQDFYQKFSIQKKMNTIQIQNTQAETILKMFQQKNSQQLRLDITTPVSKSQNNLDLLKQAQSKAINLSNHLSKLENNPKTYLKRQTTISTNYSERHLKEEEEISLSQFQIIGLIGKGSFGEVFLVKKIHQLYAMKVLDKSRIIKHNLFKYAQTERNVLSVTSHPFIVKLRYAFQTQEKLFMILDYCPGGDLGEVLEEKKRIPEDLVKHYLCEIILAIQDLHQRDIIYRDLKPENIVIDVDGHALLTDFGLSKEGIYDANQGARSFCGSVAYLAPEMLKREGHGKAVDWYLLGVLMYELLVGIPPYYANEKEQLFQNIQHGVLKIPPFISEQATNLLKSLLQRNPAKRLGSGKSDSEEVKLHPFFEGVDWNQVMNRELQLPKPSRKISINTSAGVNLFANSKNIEQKDNHVNGWSYIHNE